MFHQNRSSRISATSVWSSAQLRCVAGRSVFAENGHLTTQRSHEQLKQRLDDQNGHQSASKCSLHFQTCHPRRSDSAERGPPRTLRHEVWDSAYVVRDDRVRTEGIFRPPIPWRSGHPPSQIQFCASGKCRSMDRLSQRLGLRLFLVPKCRSGRISQGARRHLPSHSAALRLG